MTILSANLETPAVSVALHAASSAERTAVHGLIVIAYALSAAPAREAVLEVTLAGAAQPALCKAVALGEAVAHGWLALHGHLLPNGPAEVMLRLRADGQILAERTLTLQVRNAGATARQVAASLRARGAPLVLDGVCDSTAYDYADPALAAWFDRSPEAVEAHLAGLAANGSATPEEIAALRHFAEQGYLRLPEKIAEDHLDRLNAALDDAVARKVEGYEWGASQRLHNLHHHYPAIRELWRHPQVMRMLALIFGEPADPYQSLTYIFGSEQQYHQDTIHLTPFPAGRMCGVWTALEDVQPDCGELIVFPGSHKLPPVYMAAVGARKVTDDWTEFGETVAARWGEMIRDHGLERRPYRPTRGEVLIWHANLLHAGMVRRDKSKSRRSIVGHYFARGAVVYHDSSGMPGVLETDERD